MSAEHTLGSGGAGKWSLAEGDELGGYRVMKPLGRGGMGEVYLVEHVEMGKRYAMKLLSPEHSREPAFRDRFRVEARLMADLRHPGIVQVHNMGEDDGRYFLVMDYVEAGGGEPVTLDALIRKRKLRESEARSLAIGIARALDYAHTFAEAEGQAPSKVRPALTGVGVVHRDLKPGNVLIGADGRVRVSDFGLAKVMGEAYLRSVLAKSVHLSMSAARTVARDGEAASPGLTQSDGAVLGTFEYMAPEQKEGRADARSDLYSLGLIIYRMLTGKRAEGRFPDPSRLGLPDWWDRVIDRTLAPEPDDRYASVAALLEDLERERAPAPTSDAAAPASGARVASPAPRRRALAGVFTAGLIVAVAIVVPLLVGTDTPPPVPEETCEFLAWPAAALYIDGELVRDEIPPLYRAALPLGRHTVRFVAPAGESREITINVHKGRPTRCTMNFVSGKATVDPPPIPPRPKPLTPEEADRRAWTKARVDAVSLAALGDYDGALAVIKRFLDTAKTVKFKPQAVGLHGEIEQRKIEAVKQGNVTGDAADQVQQAFDGAFPRP